MAARFTLDCASDQNFQHAENVLRYLCPAGYNLVHLVGSRSKEEKKPVTQRQFQETQKILFKKEPKLFQQKTQLVQRPLLLVNHLAPIPEF